MIENQTARAMALMICAMLVLPVMDVFAKILSTQYGVTPVQITFGRFMLQAFVWGAGLAFLFGKSGFASVRWKGNLIRGVLTGAAVLLFFTALQFMPLADAIAVFLTEPFILTILSVIFLKEKVGWRRGAALITGFIGAMFIIQPSYEVFGAVAFLPLGAACFFALYLLLTRMLAGDDDPIKMQFGAAIGACGFLLAVMGGGTLAGIEVFSSPDIPPFGIRWTYIFLIGLLASFGHLAIAWAFKWAKASVLAPFQYLEIVTGVSLGYWVFGDFPDGWKWFGMALIVGAGIYLFVREAKMAEKYENRHK